jgi:predicted tellurium resistance membrane protein TerC
MDTLKQLLDFSWTADSAAWIGLLTLVLLEVVLGVDNIVFISILTGKLPKEQQQQARKKGLILAVLPRIIFLMLLGIILGLSKPLFDIPWPFEQAPAHEGDPVREAGKLSITGKDLVLLLGGLFLLWQAVREIHHKLEGEGDGSKGDHTKRSAAGLGAVMAQIMFMNIIFSLDSIVTAIGMTKLVPVMILSVLISTAIMIIAVDGISSFVDKHPSVKMLALAFLLLIGTNLIAEAAHVHIPKGYVYFAMAFSVFVEVLNIKTSGRRSEAVKLHPPA